MLDFDSMGDSVTAHNSDSVNLAIPSTGTFIDSKNQLREPPKALWIVSYHTSLPYNIHHGKCEKGSAKC